MNNRHILSMSLFFGVCLSRAYRISFQSTRMPPPSPPPHWLTQSLLSLSSLDAPVDLPWPLVSTHLSHICRWPPSCCLVDATHHNSAPWRELLTLSVWLSEGWRVGPSYCAHSAEILYRLCHKWKHQLQIKSSHEHLDDLWLLSTKWLAGKTTWQIVIIRHSCQSVPKPSTWRYFLFLVETPPFWIRASSRTS